jgi:hypothetical protein
MKTIIYILWLVSIFVLGAQNSCFAQVLTYPNTNTVWYPGDHVTITWDTNAFAPNTRIVVEIRSDKVTPFGVPIGFGAWIYYYEANSGRVEWVVPDIATTDTTYQILLSSDESYGRTYNSGYFQVRFGHKRPDGSPKLTIKQAIYIGFEATYANLYRVESTEKVASPDGWEIEGYVVADREDFGVSLIVSGAVRSYRVIDMGPLWQYL